MSESMGHSNHHPTNRFRPIRRTSSLIISLALMVCAGVLATWVGALGQTWYVDDNTCPATGNGSLTTPYCRIQDAICAAVSGDTVSVAPGTYFESLRMRPGVSVISQGGAPQTIINATGIACMMMGNYCTRATGSQCSVVLFGSGHTPTTRLEGFTLTGGAGVVQTTPAQVAGGGIFVFSSPTIVNNVITNNVLSGPKREYNGAGVYVALGAPVISNNTITGNRAVPGAGSAGLVTYGYGGGIWVGWQSDPIITNNVITGNRAGDPNAAYSLGNGGGIIVWPGDANHPGPRIDRNLIADNLADTQGGGVSTNSQPGTTALAVITNNVIVGNRAQNGGGVYVYFNRSNVVNNTIVDNTAFLGGGVFSGQNEPPLAVSITNNIIEGNHLDPFGTGGGLYTLDLSTTFDPVIASNDLWGNQKNQVGGEQTDATVIGSQGNFSADPRYVNRAARDFHLDPNSPAIDRASSTLAPPIDKDGVPRGFDGNGIPNNPMPGDIDVGAYERAGACTPSTEVCDGLDNNCNNQVDEGFLDTDTDGQANCVDPDDDNDGALDGGDCAPLDGTAFGMPSEVTNVSVTGQSPSQVSYDAQAIGSGTEYEVLSGLVRRLLDTQSFNESFCAAAYSGSASWMDTRPAPRMDDAWFYLVRSKNACGRSTLGSPQADAPRPSDSCLIPIVDNDNDGSPSDLDCNDSSALQSPLWVEVCDGLDNDCDTSVDEALGSTTCGVGACQRTVQLCVGGVTQTCTPGAPSTEVCDGIDNDCNAQLDEGFPNTDGDALANCVDPDDDNDGASDGFDCAPLDMTAFGVPAEVSELDVAAGTPTSISWVQQLIGSGTTYPLASGQIAASGVVSFPAATCLGAGSFSPATDARPDPPIDTVYFYLVKSRNFCGPGTYGTAARDTIPACP